MHVCFVPLIAGTVGMNKVNIHVDVGHTYWEVRSRCVTLMLGRYREFRLSKPAPENWRVHMALGYWWRHCKGSGGCGSSRYLLDAE